MKFRGNTISPNRNTGISPSYNDFIEGWYKPVINSEKPTKTSTAWNKIEYIQPNVNNGYHPAELKYTKLDNPATIPIVVKKAIDHLWYFPFPNATTGKN